MDISTAHIVHALNNRFYQRNSQSFAATRQTPWAGWKRCLSLLKSNGLFLSGNEKLFDPQAKSADTQQVMEREQCQSSLFKKPNEQLVLDLACGNLRFMTYLETSLPEIRLTYHAVDNCPELFSSTREDATSVVRIQNLDILEVLLSGQSLNSVLEAPVCDVSVCFGFFHHIPSQEYRNATLAALVQQTRPGGMVIVSLWQFLNNENLSKKAHRIHNKALRELNIEGLDENDFLLGWKDMPGQYRYCHSFLQSEVDQLIDSVFPQSILIDRFVADGKTNDLNTYLMLQVK